jgi:hypothetical protein
LWLDERGLALIDTSERDELGRASVWPASNSITADLRLASLLRREAGIPMKGVMTSPAFGSVLETSSIVPEKCTCSGVGLRAWGVRSDSAPSSEYTDESSSLL